MRTESWCRHLPRATRDRLPSSDGTTGSTPLLYSFAAFRPTRRACARRAHGAARRVVPPPARRVVERTDDRLALGDRRSEHLRSPAVGSLEPGAEGVVVDQADEVEDASSRSATPARCIDTRRSRVALDQRLVVARSQLGTIRPSSLPHDGTPRPRGCRHRDKLCKTGYVPSDVYRDVGRVQPLPSRLPRHSPSVRTGGPAP